MAKMRKVKRSVATAVIVWVGRRLLGRVQRQTMKSVAVKPARKRFARASAVAAAAASKPSPSRKKSGKNADTSKRRNSRVRRRAGQGLAFAILSTVAVAALKVGVEHVIESEREQPMVTPDFDVFADDDE